MKHLPEHLQQEIQEKGFVVYDYISFSELMQTVKRDYLEVVSVINIPLLVVCGITAIFSPWYLLYVLPLAYSLLFLVLLWKMFWRTKKYVYISRVIFTQKNILIGEDVLLHSDHLEEKKRTGARIEKIEHANILAEYEDEFEEYLSRPSRLQQVIKRREKLFYTQLSQIFSTGKHFDGNSRIEVAILLGVYIYGVSLIIFYYLGIIFGYIFFSLFALILQFFLLFSQKTELKMKFSVEKIEKLLQEIEATERVLEKKLSTFSDGEISDISGFVGEKFLSFYEGINRILLEQHQLETYITGSRYNDFIDFQKFSLYIKGKYNTPLNNMLDMLEGYHARISAQKEEIEQKISGVDEENDPEHSAPLTKKLLRLQQMERDAQYNLEKMRKMKI